MSDFLELDSKIHFFERLSEQDINYFSLTLFNKDHQPIISHCNHAAWLNLYNLQYHKQGLLDPIQKYIFSSKLRLLRWDLFAIDKEAKDFIEKRNELVATSKNISIIFQRQEHLTAITLGTKKKAYHLMDFLNQDLKSLFFMANNLPL